MSTHGLVLPDEVVRLWSLVGTSLLFGILTAVFYIGLEPALRRRWPHRIVAWTRLLDGRFRDPLVGRELLAGAVGATLFVYIPVGGIALSRYLGLSHRHHMVQTLEPAGWGVPGVSWAWPFVLAVGTLMALGFAVLTFSLIMLVRSELVAGLLFSLVMVFGLSVRDSLTEPAVVFVTWLPVAIMTVDVAPLRPAGVGDDAHPGASGSAVSRHALQRSLVRGRRPGPHVHDRARCRLRGLDCARRGAPDPAST